MFNFLAQMSSVLDWAPWVLGTGGVLFGAFSYVTGFNNVLSILSNCLTIMTPALQGIMQSLKWFIQEFLLGIGAVFKTPAVLTLILVSSLLSAGVTYKYEQDKVVQVTAQRDFNYEQMTALRKGCQYGRVRK